MHYRQYLYLMMLLLIPSHLFCPLKPIPKKKLFILAAEKDKKLFDGKSKFYKAFHSVNENYTTVIMLIKTPLLADRLLGLATLLADNLITAKKKGEIVTIFAHDIGVLLAALTTNLLDPNITKPSPFSANNKEINQKQLKAIKVSFEKYKPKIFQKINTTFKLSEKLHPRIEDKISQTPQGFISPYFTYVIKPLCFIDRLYLVKIPQSGFDITPQIETTNTIINLWSNHEKSLGSKHLYKNDKRFISVDMLVDKKNNLLLSNEKWSEKIFEKLGGKLLETPISYFGYTQSCNRYSLLFPIKTNEEPILIALQDKMITTSCSQIIPKSQPNV